MRSMPVHSLITGGTGFLGKYLVRFLEQLGHKVTVLGSRNCDLTERANLLKFTSEKYDYIYHLAAWTKAGDFCLHYPGDQWIINQAINTNVLWYWHTWQSQAILIAMGTSCAYPYADEPLEETMYMQGEPDIDLYTYAMTKRMLYTGLCALHKQFGLEYRYLIPSTLYGPEFEAADRHFVFDLIKKIDAGKYLGEPVILWGTGEQVRELIHVDDALQLIQLAIEGCPNDLLNLGSGQGYTIRQYAEIICEIIGYDPKKIQYDTTKYSGNPKRFFNTTKIKKLFPSFDFRALSEGLKEAIEAYQGRTHENKNNSPVV
jgi:GDP-L-fucose synthase